MCVYIEIGVFGYNDAKTGKCCIYNIYIDLSLLKKTVKMTYPEYRIYISTYVHMYIHVFIYADICMYLL